MDLVWLVFLPFPPQLPLFIYLFIVSFALSINGHHLLLLLVNIKCENIFEFLDGRNTIAICDFAFTKWCQTAGIRKRFSESLTAAEQHCFRAILLQLE